MSFLLHGYYLLQLIYYRILIASSSIFPQKSNLHFGEHFQLSKSYNLFGNRSDNPRYILYKDVLVDGLEKLKKYYSQLDEKPSFVLALGKD